MECWNVGMMEFNSVGSGGRQWAIANLFALSFPIFHHSIIPKITVDIMDRH